jgi:hypothetical protein
MDRRLKADGFGREGHVYLGYYLSRGVNQEMDALFCDDRIVRIVDRLSITI